MKDETPLPEICLKITEKYLNKLGDEIPKEELLPDLSNVASMIRTQEMTYPEFERKFHDVI